MPRLVQVGSLPTDAFPAGVDVQKATAADGYLTRVAKYVPAETVALFVGVQNLIETATGVGPPNGPTPQTAALAMNAVFIICVVGTPIYLYIQRERGRPWKLNVVLSSLAFPIWVLALHTKFGWFATTPTWFAGFLLMLYTYLIGMFKPPTK